MGLLQLLLELVGESLSIEETCGWRGEVLGLRMRLAWSCLSELVAVLIFHRTLG
jgi:hypothetical protein